MKILLFTLTLLFCSSAQADLYIDAGAEAHLETNDSFYQKNGEPIKNPIGFIEMGYEYNQYSVFARHSSSMQQEDSGLNTIGFKIRMTR